MSGGVAFVDPLAPHPYSGVPGALTGLGGTEMALVKVCERLAQTRQIVVHQRARQSLDEVVAGVRYAGFDVKRPLANEPATIVVINSWKVALKLARSHPEARVLCWLHVFPGRHNRSFAAELKAADIQIVCVSKTHADWLRQFLGAEAPSIRFIYNPIADHLAPDDTPRDPDLLLFASSPHKGLGQVFRRFEALRERFPHLKLAVADPGYLAWPTGRVPAGIRPLGRLEHSDLIGWMRRALCLFAPQDEFAETFGLVIAEANAVGCPGLLQRGLGANDEVASDSGQCIDTSDPEMIAERIANWRTAEPASPSAQARPDFRLSSVTAQWSALLGGRPLQPVRPEPSRTHPERIAS